MVDFVSIERKWQERWEKAKIFEVKEDNKKKFYVLEMFPYPSASGLHMGHALNYTIGDIYARFKRMNGFNILYPMGYDAFGLPAENAAIKENEHPKKFTEKAINNFIKQQKELGLSYDWSRMIKTCEPEYYKWNQYFFLKFLDKGLAYRKKSAVNWCPKCQTVLANEQVHSGKCWRHVETSVEIKHLEQWFLKITDYAEELLKDIKELEWPERIKIMQENWIGRSEGVDIFFEINGEKWKIFTTRPDTIYGVTFMVISSQHPRLMELVTKEQKKEVEKFLSKLKSTSQKDLEELEKEGVFTGSYAINPVNNEKVPVYAGNFVLADYGSGMVMAVPAHDQRDFEFAKKYKIRIKQVIRENLLGILRGVGKNIKEELDKTKLDYVIKEDSYFIKSISAKKENIFRIVQKYMDENSYSEFFVNGNIFIVLKNKIIDLSKENLEKVKKEISTKSKEFLGLSEIKEKWKTFFKNDVWNSELKRAYTEEGILINSDKFDGMNSKDAIREITNFLEKKKIAKKTVNYKLRDWLISRQRYWGTPIPIVYCKKCGIVKVPEKDLPVLLPEEVKFGKGNPLETNKDFVETKCPKCNSDAKRETDTMDTFFDSSWYFLRYCDNKNEKEAFNKSKVSYWMPVDQYIGGAEHACMHLIYARFFTKVLRDLGYVSFNEPFTKLFNQGMLHGEDGFVMSKSRGNVVLPEEVSKKYGIDSARLFLVSMASPDKDVQWNEHGIEGSLKFILRLFDYFSNINEKIGKSRDKLESKINKTIKEVTLDIENFRYNLAVIKIRELFDFICEEKEISKSDLENFLKILNPFCPHITEELWEKIGNENFLSIENWPSWDEEKINEKFEKEEKAIKDLINDIRNILKILENKGVKKNKIKIFVIPSELDMYREVKEKIKKIFNMDSEIFSIKEASKIGKIIKAAPGKPGIFVE